MTTKRKPIDPSALAAVAMPQPDPVAKAVMPERLALAPAKAGRPATRTGKVGVQLWIDPLLRKRLKTYSAQTERTMDSLLTEAVHDLIAKYKIP